MAAHFDSYYLDNGLTAAKAGATHIHVTSAEATSFANVATVTLGNKSFGAGNVFPGAIAAGSGANTRKLTTAAVTDGSVTATGTATNWAITDATNTRLVAVGALSTSQVVTSGNSLTLPAYDVQIAGQ